MAVSTHYPEAYVKHLDNMRQKLVTAHADTKVKRWQQDVLDALEEDKHVLVNVPRRFGKTFIAAKIANRPRDHIDGAPLVLDDAHTWWEEDTPEEKILENVVGLMSRSQGSVLVMQTLQGHDSNTKKIEEYAREHGYTILSVSAGDITRI